MKLVTRIWVGILWVAWCTLATWAAVVPLVSHDDSWHYHKGTSAPQGNWTNAPDSALDASWLLGRGGFGFADQGGQETNNCQTVLADMKNLYPTLYVRKEFAITKALEGTERLYLRVDWDDGFIGWLDGRPLTNRFVTGAPAQPAHTNLASASHESSLGNSSPQPAETYDLGWATNWLAPGRHTLALIGLNQSVGSTDFILVPDLFLDVPPAPVLIAEDTTWSMAGSPYTWTNAVVVASPVTLTIAPGVVVRFGQGCGLTVRGQLRAEGTASQPIRFTRAPGATTWERIQFVQAAPSVLRDTVIEYCDSVGDHKDYYPIDCGPPPVFAPRQYHEAVVVLASHVDVIGCTFTNLPDASTTAEGDALAIISDDPEYPGPASAIVRGCQFIRIGQGVHTRYASVLVENCVFRDKHGDNDDVDLYGESDPPSMIRSNLFLYPSYDDRINPTRSSAWIVGNTIYGSTDHGIVLRDVSQPVVMNNVLHNCTAGGISVQNRCDALIVNNTLVNCNRAIKLFDHTARWGPPYCLTPGSGQATILNCVIWNCNPAFDLADSSAGQSYVYVAYSDVQGGTNNATVGPNSTLVAGPGNLDADPRFASPTSTNFHLLAGSPAIDTGTNQTPLGLALTNIVTHDFEGTPRPLDGDGTGGARYDLGAYEFLLATADSNGDGIPDGWCQRYGLDPLDAAVAGSDPDDDGQTTFSEWVADTVPTDPLSRFQILSVSDAPPLTVRFQSSFSRTYTLLFATNLVASPPGTAWTTVAGQVDVPGTGDLMNLRDTNAVPPAYYRLEVKTP